MIRPLKNLPTFVKMARPCVLPRNFSIFKDDKKSEAAQKAVDSVKQAAKDIKENPTVNRVVETAKQTAKDIRDNPTVNRVVETAKQTAQDIRENPTVNKAVEGAKQAAQDIKDSPTVQKVVDAAKSKAQEIRDSDAVSRAVDAAKEKAQEAREYLNEYAMSSPSVYSNSFDARVMKPSIGQRLFFPAAAVGLFYFNHPYLAGAALAIAGVYELSLSQMQGKIQNTIQSIDYNSANRTFDVTTVSGKKIHNIAYKDLSIDRSTLANGLPMVNVRVAGDKTPLLLFVPKGSESSSKSLLRSILNNEYNEVEKYWHANDQDKKKQ